MLKKCTIPYFRFQCNIITSLGMRFLSHNHFQGLFSNENKLLVSVFHYSDSSVNWVCPMLVPNDLSYYPSWIVKITDFPKYMRYDLFGMTTFTKLSEMEINFGLWFPLMFGIV